MYLQIRREYSKLGERKEERFTTNVFGFTNSLQRNIFVFHETKCGPGCEIDLQELITFQNSTAHEFASLFHSIDVGFPYVTLSHIELQFGYLFSNSSGSVNL